MYNRFLNVLITTTLMSMDPASVF